MNQPRLLLIAVFAVDMTEEAKAPPVDIDTTGEEITETRPAFPSPFSVRKCAAPKTITNRRSA